MIKCEVSYTTTTTTATPPPLHHIPSPCHQIPHQHQSTKYTRSIRNSVTREAILNRYDPLPHTPFTRADGCALFLCYLDGEIHSTTRHLLQKQHQCILTTHPLLMPEAKLVWFCFLHIEYIHKLTLFKTTFVLNKRLPAQNWLFGIVRRGTANSPKCFSILLPFALCPTSSNFYW